MAFSLKDWSLANVIGPIFAVIKPKIVDLDTRLTELKTFVESMGGDFQTSVTDLASAPTVDLDGKPLSNGDWILLTADDTSTSPVSESGIYFWDGTDWVFGMEIPSLVDIAKAIIATPAEVAAGTLTNKAASVAELKAQYALKAGEDTVVFNAAEGTNDTEVVVVSQLNGTITDAEAETEYNNS